MRGKKESTKINQKIKIKEEIWERKKGNTRIRPQSYSGRRTEEYKGWTVVNANTETRSLEGIKNKIKSRKLGSGGADLQAC